MIGIEFLKDEQQLVIAEFLYAEVTDTLIKSEAQAVIKVFQELRVPEAFVTNLIVEDVCKLINENIADKELDLILSKYTTGKL